MIELCETTLWDKSVETLNSKTWFLSVWKTSPHLTPFSPVPPERCRIFKTAQTTDHSTYTTLNRPRSISRVVSIMPKWHAETSANVRGDWNGIFRLSRANQEDWLLPTFIPFQNSLHRWREVRQWTPLSNFGRNIATEISGPPPEVIFRSEETETDHPIWIATEISGIFDIRQITHKYSNTAPRLSGQNCKLFQLSFVCQFPKETWIQSKHHQI